MAARNNPFSSDSSANTCASSLRRLMIVKNPMRKREIATARMLWPSAAGLKPSSGRWNDSATTYPTRVRPPQIRIESGALTMGRISRRIWNLSTSLSSQMGTRIALTIRVSPAAMKICGAWLNVAMTAAIAASRNDCTAKIRILVTIQRWPAMAICSTSTSAAINVTSLSPNCGSSGICVSEQEGRHQGECSQCKRHRQHFGHTEQTQLGVGGLHQNNRATEQAQLEQQPSQPAERTCHGWAASQAERPEHIDQQRHEHQLLHGSGPLDKRQVRPGVLQNHGLVYHGEFQMGRGIIHRDPSGFGDQHQVQRGAGEHLRRRKKPPVPRS